MRMRDGQLAAPRADRPPLNIQTSFASFNPEEDTAGLVDGFRAWTVVFGAFVVHVVVIALLYSFGIFVLPISDEFNIDRGEVSLVGTLALVAFNFTGIFSGPLADKFGCRRVIIIGTIFWTSGNVLGSFAVNVEQLMVTQGILAGIGTAFVYWPTIASLPMWFDKLRATAVGFAVVGAGVGNLGYALGGQALISSLGWRHTLLWFGIGGGVLLLIPIILVERRLPPTRKITLFATPRELIHVRSYRFFLVASFFFQTAFFIPFIHLDAYTRDLGFSSSDSALAIAMLGIGSSVGRVTVGPLADVFGRMFMFRLCMGCAAICMFLWPTCTTIAQIYVFAFFYAYFGGGFISVSPVVAGGLWGVHRLGGIFVLVNLVQIPGGLMASPLAGLAYTATGSYIAAIIPAGFLLAFACAALFFVVPSPESTPTPSLDVPIADSLVSSVGTPATRSQSSKHLSMSNTELIASNPTFSFGGLADGQDGPSQENERAAVKQMV